MDKRKYMKPTCEAVAVNTSQSLLTIVSLTSLSTTTHTARNGEHGYIRKRNDIAREVDPWSWECVLWNQESNDVEDE